MYTAFDIAKYFLYKSQQDNQELISNMKLQKLLYYAQGLHLVFFNKPLFSQKIYAWTYGPVVKEIYHYYKEHGSQGIPADENFSVSLIDDSTKDFLDEIYSVFGQFSAIRLMEISHADTCWKNASSEGEEITHEAMLKCLKKYTTDET